MVYKAPCMHRPLVFIIDDDDAIREAFSDVLSDAGYEIRSYRNGREADRKSTRLNSSH